MRARRGVVMATVFGAVALSALALLAPRARRAPSMPDAATAPSSKAPLAVELSGCAAVLRGPACETSPGSELRLFVPGATDGDLRIRAGGRDLPAAVTPWPDGRTLRVTVPAGASSLEVRAERGADELEGAAGWTIALVPAAPPVPAVERARALRKQGKLDEAAAALGGELPSDGGARSSALSVLARIEYARGRIDDAVARFREAIALHAAEGRSSEAADDTFALVFLLLERGRFGEVRPLLARAAELSRDWPDGQASVTYNEGLLAWDTGDLRLALRRTRDAERHAARIGWARLRRMAAQSAARQLLDLGRTKEALDALRALLASDGGEMIPCDRADLLNNIGWAAALLEAEVDPRDPLRQALDAFRASCPDPNRIANALENVALAELHRSRLAEAKAALDEARRVEQDPAIPVVLFWDHLAGRIALASGKPRDAAAPFLREASVAGALGNGEDQRLAAEDRAEAFSAMGKKNEALAVLDAADALVDAGGAFVPLGEGKESFFGTRDRAAALQVSLLVELGRAADAMIAARRARARVLSGLRGRAALEGMDERARGRWEEAFQRYRAVREAIDADAAHDWELSADRLAAALARRRDSSALARATLDDAVALLSPGGAPPARAPHALLAGELELLYFPTSGGWFGFARDDRGVRARSLGAVDAGAPPDLLAAKLLAPFDEAIARATRLRLMPYGAARAVDVHTLPWRGAPLESHATVEYALDLGDAPPARDGDPADRALVVGDPAGDLPAARAEASAVADAFARDGAWRVELLRGPDARGDAVRAALGAANVFHYAGHARFGGPDALDSALPLAGGGALTPGDVLALPRVPPIVALFGCETGRDSANGASDALGLANAFLLAGARAVLATSRMVDDALARDLAAELYPRLVAARGDELAGADPARILRDARTAARAKRPDADWAAFRALVR